MRKKTFDVVVIGGGHAGIEASHLLAKAKFSVALLTLSKKTIGKMSCNPSIGGVGKGHLVREIDALGGLMAKIADKTGIQFRILNSSKGSAVQGLRCQSDRELYSKEIQSYLLNLDHLEIIEGEAHSIEVSANQVTGVLLSDGTFLKTKNVVIATGTFLKGKLFTGFKVTPGGRIGEPSSESLSSSLERIGIKLKRLKTGTPARLNKNSIDYSVMEIQYGDPIPEPFSLYSNPFPVLPQICCHITYTTKETAKIVLSSLDRSPLYGGLIKGIGPRYCPSLEDKIVKFPHHERHHVFIEPEGLSSDLVYPNGISTSLPEDVQDKFIRTIPGLENCEIVTFGYAVEYDFLEPTNLNFDLCLKGIDGLYFVGQVIGTTGYEEAASLGLYCAYNIIKKLKGKEPFRLKRSESYIGVMVDDLVLKGVLEPYRIFTSRAEHRMLLDRHTAYRRLTPYAKEENLIDDKELTFRENYEKEFQKAINELKSKKMKGGNLYELLKKRAISFEEAFRLIKLDNIFLKNYIESEIKNEGYKKRFLEEAAKLEGSLFIKIPNDLDYKKISGFSREVIERLSFFRPENLYQASRIPGITPSALNLLRFEIERRRRKKNENK